jgi:glycosyltransferase involved in cell wall biosynthesis
MPKLYCIIVTFRRPDGFERVLECAMKQTVPPVEIVVVDNEGSDLVERLVDAKQGGPTTITYIRTGENLGPAGGTAVGMERILEVAGDEDWITRLDDDLDGMDDDIFEELLRFAVEQRSADPAVGAVGAVGSRYDWSTGRLMRIDDSEIEAGPVPVDYVPTNLFPAFNVGVVRTVGVLDRRLFYGSSEVEYGLRLRAAGVRILANPVLWKRLGRQTATTAGAGWRLRQLDWRRYYSLRNQVYVLRNNGHRWTAVKVSITRGLAKPLFNLFVAPLDAWGHLKLNSRAIFDGWRGNMGRTLEPW